LKYIKLLTYIILINPFCFFGQTHHQIDSLSKILIETQSETQKARIHNRLGWLYISKDIQKAKAHIDTSFVLFHSLKDRDGEALCFYKYGVIARVSGQYKKALEYIDKYLDFVKSKHDSINIANGLYQRGVVFSLLGDYEKSLEEYYKSYLIYKSCKDSTSMGFCLNSIGIVYNNLEKYPLAVQTLIQTIHIHKKRNDLPNLANVYNSLGTVYAKQNLIDSALIYFNKSLNIDNRLNNNWGKTISHKNIGSLLLQKKQYKKALTHFKKSYQIQLENNLKINEADILGKIGETYTLLGDYSNAEEFLKKSLNEPVPSKRTYKNLHFQSFKLYNKLKNYKKALAHYEKYVSYKDSILNEKKLNNINRLQIQFETQKKDNEIIRQQLLLDQKNIEIQKNKIQKSYMAAVALFLLTGMIITWLFFRQHQKRKNQEIEMLKRDHQIKSLELLIEGEEKERIRIAQELHDGVNGDLSAIKYKLSSLQKNNSEVINDAIEMIDKSCRQVRAISHNLTPPSLKKFNIIETTETFCHNLNAIHKPNIRFQHIGDIPQISKKVQINIFRIIQELVTNSIKHADATEIDVQISCRNKQIQIIVEDNGSGFDTQNTTHNGIGLRNIQSRIDYLQASIDVVSNKNGTSYTIEIDINKLYDH